MLNITEFTERLKKVLEYYEESASSFSEKIGVQRSSISHILSGRNKPSLDFILKILHTYPDIELYWLLIGKGSFPPEENETQNTDVSPNLFSEKTSEAVIEEKIIVSNNTNDSATYNHDIERIIIFFRDGSFKSYKN